MRLAFTGLSSWFESGATIVTPSSFAAAVVNQQFARYQLDSGRKSWQRSRIYSVDLWLSALWTEARYRQVELPILLSASQEHALWQKIIEEHHANLFDARSTAGLAMRAANIMAEWELPAEGDAWREQEDAQHFHEWHKLLLRRCRQQNWITHSGLWRQLPKWIASGACSRKLTVFAGFEPFSPALKRLQAALGDGAAREVLRPCNPSRPGSALPCTDFANEVEHVARWSRAIFEDRPSCSIGIFVPDLDRHRALVERTFHQVFYPSAGLFRAENRPEPDSVFHVNAAPALSTHPLIANALLILELARERIDIGAACAILRSPFIFGAAAERRARALADLELRKKRQLEIELPDLEFAAANCPLLAPVWARLRRIFRRKIDRVEPAIWSEYFGDILEAVGWPGEGALQAKDQDISDAWKRALSSLAALGLVSGPVSYERALIYLRGLLSARGIERGDWSSPIQIVDGRDAPGLEFDHVFAAGLSDESWPPAFHGNPLLPLRLQRACDVPQSSPESTHLEQERLTRALFLAAPAVTATYSGRLSPLAAPFVTREPVELRAWQGKLPRETFTPAALDEVEDANAPVYQQRAGTRGGASLVRAQSLCPFRAFAEFRLAAFVPEDGCFGFDSRERGGFAHRALQIAWSQIRTHRALRAMPGEELRALVRDAVEQAVTNTKADRARELLSRTERDRLEQVITEWLDLERSRKHSFPVETLEQDRFYDFPGLRLRLRVDRLDRLPNGNLILIDYKSGPQSRGKLKCPRPAEPQLLVYATALENGVDGLFFGELRARDPRAVGFSREKHFPGPATDVTNDWNLFLAQARAEVERLASEFVDGHAAVDPIKGACDFCQMKPFCRVNETVQQECEEE